MKTLLSLLTVTLLGVGAAQAQVDLPDPSAPGHSPASAVRLLATNDLMVERMIKRWLRAHYPDWHADPHQFQEIGLDRYAVVYISAPERTGRRIYFKIRSRVSDDDDDAFPSF
jgi:hypothetical protein